MLTKFKDDHDHNLIAELLLTIASLIVRNEFCTIVEEAGGLKYTLDVMVEYPDSVKINREALKLLKALAGNDKVKVHIIQNGAAVIIEATLNKFKVRELYESSCKINQQTKFFFRQMKVLQGQHWRVSQFWRCVLKKMQQFSLRQEYLKQ